MWCGSCFTSRFCFRWVLFEVNIISDCQCLPVLCISDICWWCERCYWNSISMQCWMWIWQYFLGFVFCCWGMYPYFPFWGITSIYCWLGLRQVTRDYGMFFSQPTSEFPDILSELFYLFASGNFKRFWVEERKWTDKYLSEPSCPGTSIAPTF